MQITIVNKVHEIANILFLDMKGGKLNDEGIGLLAGQNGIIIFCKRYLRLFPDDCKEKILDEFIESYFDKLTSEIDIFTYCAGLAGALEGLKYLNDKKLMEVDFSEIESHYKDYMQTLAISNIKNGNYDYLHGGLGIAKYFYNDPEFINRVLEALEQTAEKDEKEYKWVSRLGHDKGTGYNISLSHGMSSIVSVLSLLTDQQIDQEKRDRIITRTCNYILSQEIDSQKYGCYFPSQSLENNPKQDIYASRLGWCYGDLGVATSLWQAGKVLQNQNWQHKALEVLRFSASRKDFRECGIHDAGLCHGAASVCMMYHYVYKQTGEKLFEETRDFWLDSILKMGCMDNGLAGYKIWCGAERGGWEIDYGVLEGVAGIGLMLLTILEDAPQQEGWLNFFMLNYEEGDNIFSIHTV